jgi:putative spermidine/putrescine transport system ATP-binding protein
VSLIDVEKVEKYYGENHILKGVDFSINTGQVKAIMGPSGSGKSTLLRLIALLEPVHSGKILFNGELIAGNADGSRAKSESEKVLALRRRGIGMVFQHYALFPQMSVEGNIGYGLRIRGISQAEQKRVVGELVDLVRLNGLEKKRPAELSGGQRQRVALARAVAVRPRVLLLDEPLTALDAKLKETLRTELAELLRRLNITAIHVTHDQQEAMAIADRLAVMQAGQIVQVGDGETLYRSPVHPFVASFLGRINRLHRDALAVERQILNFGGHEMACPVDGSHQTDILVRPEDIEVGHIQPEWGEATVMRRTFLGERVHLILDVKEQSQLFADVDKDHPARVGDKVGVRIHPNRLMPCLQTDQQ